MNDRPEYVSDELVADKQGPLYVDGRFGNPGGAKRLSGLKLSKLLKRFFVDGKPHAFPKGCIPVNTITPELLNALPNETTSLFRIGHSSILLKVKGEYWLIDPVFSKRVSPSQLVGPKRFHPTPISLQNLPPLKGIILSHNHYDHLDKASVIALHQKAEIIVMPLGMASMLQRWGIPSEKLIEFDWWQTLCVGSLQLTSTPAQHFSGRGIKDSNRSLWCSWVIDTPAERLFFSGDSGYFDGFKKIGEAFGPFHLVMMETGAYDKFWPSVHMRPEESFQAFLDLNGQYLMPIHNGTFDLSFHPWYEPFEIVYALAHQQKVALVTPEMGQRVDVANPADTLPWWRKIMPQDALCEERALSIQNRF